MNTKIRRLGVVAGAAMLASLAFGTFSASADASVPQDHQASYHQDQDARHDHDRDHRKHNRGHKHHRKHDRDHDRDHHNHR